MGKRIQLNLLEDSTPKWRIVVQVLSFIIPIPLLVWLFITTSLNTWVGFVVGTIAFLYGMSIAKKIQ